MANDVYPARGGVELHVHNLACSLSQLGHQPHVFVQAGPSSDCEVGGYRISRGVNAWMLAAGLRNFSALHAHGARTPLAAWALLAGKHQGLRTVFTPHCFYPARHWQGAAKRAVFDTLLGAPALRGSDCVICLTENDRRDALRAGARDQQIAVIPNAIRPAPLPPRGEAEKFRRRYGFGKFLLSVGRLDRVKGGDFLISALDGLPRELALVFAGPDAGCFAAWQHLAGRLGVGNRVHFLFDLPDPELHLAYCAAEALVMASSYEGLPTVLLEAMWFGVPVVAAGVGGIGCLIRHGENGFLYPCGDRAAFCSQVQSCLAGVPPEMLERARGEVKRDYCWESTGPRIAALYEDDAH